MNKILRTTMIGLLGLGFGAGAALAQPRQLTEPRDLNVEIDAAAPARPHRPHRPRRPAHAAAQPPLTASVSQTVQVSLQTIGSSTIGIGTPLRFQMVSLSSGYGHLYVINASGRTQVWLENVKLTAGRPIRYPLRGLTVRAAAPAGDEQVIFVASRDPINGFVGQGSTTQPIELQVNAEGLRAQIQQKMGDRARGDWAFAEITVRVKD